MTLGENVESEHDGNNTARVLSNDHLSASGCLSPLKKMNDVRPMPSAPANPPAQPSKTLDEELPPLNVIEKGVPAFALTGLFVLAAFYTLYFARDVLLPLVLAAMLTLVLTPVMRLFDALRIPKALASAVVVSGLLGALFVAASLLMEPASAWLAKAPQTMKQMEDKLHDLRRSVEQVTKAAQQVEKMATGESKPKVQATQQPTLTSRIIAGAQKVLLVAAPTIVLLYFLLATGDMFLRKLVKVLPTLADKRRAVTVARTVQDELAIYLFTITCINVGLGIVTGIAMYLLGMPNPALWGVMVAVFNYVPYLGPLVSNIILTTVAALTFDSLGQTLAVPAVFFCITFIEGQILMPFITGRRLTLNPVVIFLSMLLWGWLWGVIGMLLAVPIAMTFRIVCSHVEWLSPLGEFLSSERTEIPEG